MKNFFKKLGSVLFAATLLSSAPTVSAFAAEHTDFRGVWISTVYSADYPTVQNDAEAQKAEFIEKLDKLQAIGINAVVVQVRPKGDAFYESELNPWSEVLTGTQGLYPGYDPMEFMIEEAHKRGMEFHAWMNPYRITTSGTDLAKLSADNMARQHPDWIITYNGAMYYNPEKTEVKEYICDTVAEVVKNYDVDAIHFDDYFYPTNYPLAEGESRDGAQANERREHVNDMISMVSAAIKSIKADVDFGISPMGIWKNSTSDPSGSATSGSEGYYAVYGDALKWLDEGCVDYIAPQVYWERGNAYADYETLIKWWSDEVKGTGVKLYIGQGIYKDIVAKEISSQLDINSNYSVEGSIFFSARDLFDDREGAATALKTYYSSVTTSQGGTQATTPQQLVTVERKTAYASKVQVSVNGSPVSLEAYIIDDYSYFKLRDIAAVLNGTPKQFSTTWNEAEGAIYLQGGAGYTGAASVGSATQNTIALTSTARLYYNDEEKAVSAYNINDYTYYKLRDIGQLIDTGIEWNEAAFSTNINTSKGY